MKKILLSLVLILNFYSAYAQVESSDRFKIAAPGYFQEFLNFDSGEPGLTRMDVFIQVPYQFLQFIKVPGGFGASCNITISVFDKNHEQLIVEKSWTEKVETENFDITNSRNSFNLSLRSFTLTPDNYIIRSEVEDKESKKSFTTETPFTVRDLSAKPSLSDIMLIAKSTVSNGSNKVIPNVSRNVTAQKEGLHIYYELTARDPRDLEIHYIITDGEEETVVDQKKNRSIDSGKTQIRDTVNISELSLGNYNLTVKLMGKNNTIITSVTKPFYSKWAGVPSNVSDMDKAVEQLRYIATPAELDHIEEAETQNEKVKRYIEFWKKKDPAPGTEDNEVFDEYYRRIEYANQNFSHYSEGWKTDRGMVFITLGTPDNVERHPFDYDSKPYEIWDYYNLGRSFVFVDENGFGDYRLITPMHGDDYRYR
jgi:GWxTD domain-containing protein